MSNLKTKIKFFGWTAGYTLYDLKENEKDLEELFLVENRIHKYKSNWLHRIS